MSNGFSIRRYLLPGALVLLPAVAWATSGIDTNLPLLQFNVQGNPVMNAGPGGLSIDQNTGAALNLNPNQLWTAPAGNALYLQAANTTGAVVIGTLTGSSNNLYVFGSVGIGNAAPDAQLTIGSVTGGMPASWSGLHGNDLYANGAIGVGSSGQVNASLNANGDVNGLNYYYKGNAMPVVIATGLTNMASSLLGTVSCRGTSWVVFFANMNGPAGTGTVCIDNGGLVASLIAQENVSWVIYYQP